MRERNVGSVVLVDERAAGRRSSPTATSLSGARRRPRRRRPRGDHASTPVITARARDGRPGGGGADGPPRRPAPRGRRRRRLTGILTLDDLAARTGDAELAAQLSARVTRGDHARLLLPRARLTRADATARRKRPQRPEMTAMRAAYPGDGRAAGAAAPVERPGRDGRDRAGRSGGRDGGDQAGGELHPGSTARTGTAEAGRADPLAGPRRGERRLAPGGRDAGHARATAAARWPELGPTGAPPPAADRRR